MIVIIGAGLSGLTAALELVNQGYKVIIYEKDIVAGGMAKSKRINEDNTTKSIGVPTEHSWRGYMSFYYNTFDILKRIPILPTKEIDNSEKLITLDEVNKHNKIDDAWIIYQEYVYDITYFIKSHPGGSIINLALGQNINEVWDKYLVGWHQNNQTVINYLIKNKIGKLDKLTQNKTAFDNLVPIEMKMLYNTINKNNTIFNFIKDSPYIIYNYLKYLFGHNRNIIEYKTRLLDVYGKNNISKNTFDTFITMLSGPGLGLDFNNASIGSIYFYFDGYLKHYFSSKNSWYVMNKPTNEAFIDPLVGLLKTKGVNIIYNSELQMINYDANKINFLVINNEKIYGDEFILAINPNNLAIIFEKSNMDSLAKKHLAIQTTNNQISFRLGFSKKIYFENTNKGYVLMDSINNITFYPQDNFFNVPIDYNNNIKSLWSGTCVQSTLKISGEHNLTKDEFIEIIIKQFLDCFELQNEIKQFNGDFIKRSDIVYTEIYDDWFYNGTELESKNKKWVNTFYNEDLKFDNYTEYDNLYLCGGHTNTSFKIWSMESSCESGKKTANLILQKNHSDKTIFLYTHTKPQISSLLSLLDDIFYKYNIGSIVDVLLFIIIFLLLIKILKKLKK